MVWDIRLTDGGRFRVYETRDDERGISSSLENGGTVCGGSVKELYTRALEHAHLKVTHLGT